MPEQPKKTRTTEAEPSFRKICVYLGDISAEVDAASIKLGVSRSRLLARAWKLARDKIAAIPGVPQALR